VTKNLATAPIKLMTHDESNHEFAEMDALEDERHIQHMRELASSRRICSRSKMRTPYRNGTYECWSLRNRWTAALENRE